MVTLEDKFKGSLRAKGLRFTPERRLILKEIFSFHRHFDVEELYQRLRDKNIHVSRATIYRTLPLLVENGLIKEAFRRQDRIRYEHIFGHGHHDHLLCIKCGRVMEFKEERIENLQKLICERYSFSPVEHRLGIRGYCRKCRS